jgi:hypothetical protein
MSNGTFDFNVFLKDSKETLLNPKSYFSTLTLTGGITEPLIKAVIYGTLTGILYFLWGLLRLGAVGGGLLGGAVGILAFIYAIIGAVIGVFIGAVISLIISSICKGNTDFEANLRVAASVMVVMPIMAFFAFAMGLNFYLGMLVNLLINIYLLWLMYNGLVEALKCKADTAKIVCYVFAGIFVLVTLLGMTGANRATRLLNQYNKDAREVLKDLPKN